MLLTMLVLAAAAVGQGQSDWYEPFPAHKVIGNVYYVGSKDLATFLITTPEGHILINSGFERTVPLIQKSVESLGFKMTDVKILLASHAHSDHVAGHALLQKLTGAKVYVMRGDDQVIASGGTGQYLYSTSRWEPCKVDRVLKDGDEVKLGGVTLVARLTPGHTRGCTTWTWRVEDGGKTYDVVVIGSPNVNPGFKLVNNESYPEIAADFAKTFEVLKSLPCDVFLGAHGSYYGMVERYALLEEGVPFDHAVIAAVGAEKHVAGQALEDLEGLGKVGGDFGVVLVVDQLKPGIDVGAADDHDIVFLAAVLDAPGPRGAAARVAGRQTGDQRDAAELDFVAILQNAVDLARVPAAGRVQVLALAARGDDLVVAAHDIDLGAGQLLQQRVARDVVRVGMARQQDLDIGHLEAERLDRFLNQGNRALKAAVDEDVPLGSGDEIGGQILGADVVDIADDLVRRERLVPIGWALSNGGHGERQRGEKHGRISDCIRLCSLQELLRLQSLLHISVCSFD